MTTAAVQRASAPDPVWSPDPVSAGATRIADFARTMSARHDLALDPLDYAALHRWSIEHLEDFWQGVWDYFDVRSETPAETVLAEPGVPGRGWFAGARLNFAAEALRRGRDEDPAVLALTEDGRRSELTWSQLRSQVASVAAWLRDIGVGPGDRVVGYLPNGPHAVVAFLATAAVGGVWSCCGQDYGVPGALDRFTQLEPKALFAADGYVWNGRVHDRREQVAQLYAGLPSLCGAVLVDHLAPRPLPGPAATTELQAWADVVAQPRELVIDAVPAESPLWVLFSSGTTGAPKGIVHSHVGVVVEHLKQLGLLTDVHPGERMFWYTTTNWMMWNVHVCGLLVGATIIAYDGSPSAGTADRLFALAAELEVDVLGLSPGYLHGCITAGAHPARDHDLSRLRNLGVTGSPMPAATCEWAARELGPGVQIASSAGGTDVATSFVGATPLTPVWPAELSAPKLGVRLECWNDAGQPVLGEVGELVVTAPMPTMPLYFWNDPDGGRYREAYFETFPGVWRHGDWIEITERGSVIISGRSDSTVNRNGVRFGSAEIYAVTDAIEDLADCLVVGVELGDGRYWLPLFVQLREGHELTDSLRESIRRRIATAASPRHVPDDIIAVPGIPHTRTGKRLEVPVKRLLQGQRVADVVNLGAVDRPELLVHFAGLRPRDQPR